MTNENKNYLQKQNLNEVAENENEEQPPYFPTMMDEVGYDKLESIKRQKNSIAQRYFNTFQSPIQYLHLSEPKVQEHEFLSEKNVQEQTHKKLSHEQTLKGKKKAFQKNQAELDKKFSPPSLPQPSSFETEKSKILRKSDSIEQKFNSFQQEINEAKNDFDNLDW